MREQQHRLNTPRPSARTAKLYQKRPGPPSAKQHSRLTPGLVRWPGTPRPQGSAQAGLRAGGTRLSGPAGGTLPAARASHTLRLSRPAQGEDRYFPPGKADFQCHPRPGAAGDAAGRPHAPRGGERATPRGCSPRAAATHLSRRAAPPACAAPTGPQRRPPGNSGCAWSSGRSGCGGALSAAHTAAHTAAARGARARRRGWAAGVDRGAGPWLRPACG